jgi:hypothetical protein
VKRTAENAIGKTSPHRLLRVLAAVLLLVRVIQPVSLVAPTIDHHAAHRHLGRETAANTHHPERHGDRDPNHQGCHFCRVDDIALPPPSVAFVLPDTPITVAWPEAAQQTAPARHFLICLQPRAPPLLA